MKKIMTDDEINAAALALTKNSIEEKFISHLGIGRENAIKVRDLPYGSREIRFLVSSLREKGIPVCSGYEGYWIAKDQLELDETILQLNSRILGLGKAVSGLMSAEVSNEF